MKTAERPPCYMEPTALRLCSAGTQGLLSPHLPTSHICSSWGLLQELGGLKTPSKPWSALRAQGPSQGLTSKSLLKTPVGKTPGYKELPRHQVQRPQEGLPFLGCAEALRVSAPQGKAVQSPSPDQGSQEQTPKEPVGDTVPENLPRRHRHCRWF